MLRLAWRWRFPGEKGFRVGHKDEELRRMVPNMSRYSAVSVNRVVLVVGVLVSRALLFGFCIRTPDYRNLPLGDHSFGVPMVP